MAPQQNTFAVIPDAPGRVGGVANRPPMTSKQAQKLYKQATKEPRRSKAEQRKWEKERQEEIRKELEKERAAVKAKAARERKKVKEEEARESRRRAGQPLFDCRPSQDTIARFVRGNGSSKKRDLSGEPIPRAEITPTTLANIKQHPLPPSGASKPPTQIVSSEERKPSIDSMAPPARPSQEIMSAMLPPQSTTFQVRKQLAEGVAPKPTKKDASSLQVTALPPPLKPLFSVPEHPQAVTTPMGPPPRPIVKSKSRPFMMPRATLPTHQPPRHKIFKQKPPTEPSFRIKSEVPWPKELLSAISAPKRLSPEMPPPPVPSQKRKAEPMADKTPIKMVIPAIATSPPLPPPRPITQIPPPSTQAIVQDCFDEFFPTASQLAVELEEDVDSCQSALPLREGFSAPVPKKVLAKGPPGSSSWPREAKEFAQERKAEPTKNKLEAKQTQENTSSPRHLQPVVPNPQANVLQAPNPSTDRAPGPHSFAQREQTPKVQPHQVMMPQRASGPKSFTDRSTRATVNTSSAKLHGPPPLPAPSRVSKRAILQEISSNHSPLPQPTAGKSLPISADLFPMICTQDLMMSSQEVLDIESPAKAMTHSSSGGSEANPASPLIEMDLGSIDWDDDLDDF
ncbi:hypothetical protein CORC01_08128 [Colletotrichum orchidophilum]|uniref:Uncharacterized protein n=1 Tax=Colletotrichum orchidophilum TaxID=1209926 RepID=A0A1G4B512_9PEZI|nr:uncharacterized protein CORC01_08128 [Colletotrichum orchidophilum]OHE96530.1 hypothetical protein CORC01_08128 [Colletotrichum orchidophilum]